MGRCHAARFPVLGQGPAGRLVPLARGRPRRERAVADRPVPGVRGAARDRPLPRPRERPARRREARRAAGRMARRPAPDDGVPGSVVARRRDVRGPGRGRCRAVRDRAARGRRAADPAADRVVPLSPPATERLHRRGAGGLGRAASSRSCRPATTSTRSSATTRSAAARSWRSRSGRPWRGSAAADRQARSPSAGPNMTSSSSRSSMSWNLCGTVAATKTSEPWHDRPGLASDRDAGHDRRRRSRARPRCAATAGRSRRPRGRRSRPTGPGPAGTRGRACRRRLGRPRCRCTPRRPSRSFRRFAGSCRRARGPSHRAVRRPPGRVPPRVSNDRKSGPVPATTRSAGRGARRVITRPDDSRSSSPSPTATPCGVSDRSTMQRRGDRRLVDRRVGLGRRARRPRRARSAGSSRHRGRDRAPEDEPDQVAGHLPDVLEAGRRPDDAGDPERDPLARSEARRRERAGSGRPAGRSGSRRPGRRGSPWPARRARRPARTPAAHSPRPPASSKTYRSETSRSRVVEVVRRAEPRVVDGTLLATEEPGHRGLLGELREVANQHPDGVPGGPVEDEHLEQVLLVEVAHLVAVRIVRADRRRTSRVARRSARPACRSAAAGRPGRDGVRAPARPLVVSRTTAGSIVRPARLASSPYAS